MVEPVGISQPQVFEIVGNGRVAETDNPEPAGQDEEYEKPRRNGPGSWSGLLGY